MTMSTAEQTKIAETIRTQLGGRRFEVMTGAKMFVSFQREGCAGLQFKLPRGATNKSNLVTVILEGDEYTVRFLKYRNLEVKTISEHERVPAENLELTFKMATGLDTGGIK